jgi:transaldolase
VILLWGLPTDAPLAAVHQSLRHYGADVQLLDQRLAADSTVSLSADCGRISGEVTGNRSGERVNLDDARAAYLRPVETDRALPAHYAHDVAARERAIQADQAMVIWADLCHELVVNPPAAMAVNSSKPYQLGKVAGYGFAVPDTLVTTDPDAVRSFASKHGRVVYKSLSGVRSIVSTLGPAGLARLRDVANAPTQFQEHVPGADVRVHVVGNEVIATEVRSRADDYRYASLSGEDVEFAPTILPDDVAMRCRVMTAGMNLAVAGIDLRRTPDGRWVCFEVNPSPAFIFYENATGQPVGEAICRLLMHADEAPSSRAIRFRHRPGQQPGDQGEVHPAQDVVHAGRVTKLQRLHEEQGQSPWLDNLSRPYLLKGSHGTLARLVGDGIRGVTANPTIFAKAIEGADAYDQQFAALIGQGCPIRDAYWHLVTRDITDAAAVLRPVFDASGGCDGFVSVEVAPELAHDTEASIAAARNLHTRIAQPNLFVKIPATPEGVPAIQAMISEGRSINITLIFSLTRYAEVIEAYLAGLETLAGHGGDLGSVHSVASFFVSRVDTEVDRRLPTVDGSAAQAPRGRAAVAQAKLAYQLFRQHFAGPRWERLTARGAHVQRPLWASTSTKNPDYPDTLYVDNLIGPDTVNTLPEATIAAFEDHGTVARTIDADVEAAADVMDRLARLGVDIDDVGHTLEEQGVASFHESFAHVLRALETKARSIARQLP